MSTKNQTTQSQSNVYDPQSLQAYHTLNAVGQKGLLDLINNPLGSSFFNTQLGQMKSQQSRANQTQAWQATNNVQGLGGGSGYNPVLARLMQGLGRSGSSDYASGFNNLLLNTMNAKQAALGQAMNYSPLQTGGTGTSTQQTSGLGTWLPQLIGAGLGAASGIASGGASKLMNPLTQNFAKTGGLGGTPFAGTMGGMFQSAPTFGGGNPFLGLGANQMLPGRRPTQNLLGIF